MHTNDIAALHAELTNKMRWAINSSLANYGLELSFKDAMSWGSRFAETVFEASISRTKTSSDKDSEKKESNGKRPKKDLTTTKPYG